MSPDCQIVEDYPTVLSFSGALDCIVLGRSGECQLINNGVRADRLLEKGHMAAVPTLASVVIPTCCL